VSTSAIEHATTVRPCKGEQLSGDAAVVRRLESGCFAAIVDVLGHGPDAHRVAAVVERFLGKHGSGDVAGLMQQLHELLRGGRGAAAGMCAIDSSSGRLSYVATGNTVLRCFGANERRLVSQDGVIGQNMRTPRLQSLQLEPGDVVLLYTDGVRDRFTSEECPAVFHSDVDELAQTVVDRFGKDHDDAACVALRYRQ